MTLAPLTGSFWGTDLASGLANWLMLIEPLALSVLVVVAVAGLVAGRVERGTRKQRIWRLVIVTLLLITIAEASGAASWAGTTIRTLFDRRSPALDNAIFEIAKVTRIAKPV